MTAGTPNPWDIEARMRIRPGRESADQKVGAKTNGREDSDAEHHLFVPAHALLRLAHCQGAHDRHGSPSLSQDVENALLHPPRLLCARLTLRRALFLRHSTPRRTEKSTPRTLAR